MTSNLPAPIEDLTSSPEASGQRTQRTLTLNWATTLSVLTALVALGGVTLHLIGDVSHRQYLKFWGINSGLFPKSTDWILINGYYSLVSRFIAILGEIFKNLHLLAVAAVVLGLYMGVLFSPIGGGRGEIPKWLQRRSEWFRRLLRTMFITATLVGAFPLAMFLLTAVMVIPAALGEAAGKAAAESELSAFRMGCANSARPCIEVRREGQVLASGFVLDTSPSFIAIFEEGSQRGQVISLDKVELVVRGPVASSPKEPR